MPLLHLLAAFAILVPAPMPTRDGWTGQIVMSKQSGTSYRIPMSESDETVRGNLRMIEYRVIRDKGGELFLVENGKEVAVLKNDMILQADSFAYYTELIEKNPTDVRAYASRGWAHKQRKSFESALKDYGRAIELAPNQCAWRNNRALIFIEMNEFDKAIADYDAAINLFPQYALGFRNRGNCWLKKKEYAKALADFQKSIEHDPNVPSAHDSLARLLAACPNAKIRDGKKALEAAEKAIHLSEARNGAFLDTLAAAHAELGHFDEAIKYQEKAFTDPYFTKEKDKADEARKRLQLYRDKKPYRGE